MTANRTVNDPPLLARATGNSEETYTPMVQELIEIDVRCHNCGTHRMVKYAFMIAPLDEAKP